MPAPCFLKAAKAAVFYDAECFFACAAPRQSRTVEAMEK